MLENMFVYVMVMVNMKGKGNRMVNTLVMLSMKERMVLMVIYLIYNLGILIFVVSMMGNILDLVNMVENFYILLVMDN